MGTKGERRDRRKESKKRKLAKSGKSVFVLWEIILQKAKRASNAWRHTRD